jgi:hypothetical protein
MYNLYGNILLRCKIYATYVRDGDHLSVRFRIPVKQKKKHFNQEGVVFFYIMEDYIMFSYVHLPPY